MKHLIILGAGTGGTVVANRLRRQLPRDWSLIVVDPEPRHLYQPGLLFLPFGAGGRERLLRPRRKTLGDGICWLRDAVVRVEPESRLVVLEGGGLLRYDLLVIASGSQLRPRATAGLVGPHWGRTVHEFYTLAGARRLRRALAGFDRGRLVVNVAALPIKCPVAPLEFLFLADAFFSRRGLRHRVELIYATPQAGPFAQPVAAALIGELLERKGIRLETGFVAAEVDGEARRLHAGGRELGFDLLVTVPAHGGAPFIEASGLGDERAFVPTARHTLLARGFDDVFVLGDATDLPVSKAGSVAHFQSGVVAENALRAIRGRSLIEGFDGHANCFVETGHGRALLIDFNYDVEPLPGRYPLPWVGPLTLLEESRRNHWAKLAFRWLYWHLLLPGRPLPVPARLSMRGKESLGRVLHAST